MSELDNNRLVRTFAERKASGKQSLLPFLTAGYPDLETTVACLKQIERQGGRICELGIPFSDPIADGPVIQASMTCALEAGVKLADIFHAVRTYRDEGGELALLAMLSYSIVYRHGTEAFCRDAAAAGFDGLIVPDLPLEEAESLKSIAADEGLCSVLLVSPTTPPDRRVAIAKASTGFVYFMSVAGITGERKQLPDDTFHAVTDLRKHTDTPVCIGFGISTPEMVAQACQAGDGAIVGSAIIHRINDARADGENADGMARRVGQFVSELLAPLC